MDKKVIAYSIFLFMISSIAATILTKKKMDKKIVDELQPFGKLDISIYDDDKIDMYLEVDSKSVKKIDDLKKRKYAVFEIKVLEQKKSFDA